MNQQVDPNQDFAGMTPPKKQKAERAGRADREKAEIEFEVVECAASYNANNQGKRPRAEQSESQKLADLMDQKLSLEPGQKRD